MYEKINQFYDEFTAKIINANSLSAKYTKWSNTLKQFMGYHIKKAKQYLP